MSFTLVASCREALSGVVATRLIREQEEEDARAKAYEEVSLCQMYLETGGRRSSLEERQRAFLEGRLEGVYRRLEAWTFRCKER
jgi:hypothetical protein